MTRALDYDSQKNFPLGGGWLTPTELIVQLTFVFGFLCLVLWMFYFPVISKIADVETIVDSLLIN